MSETRLYPATMQHLKVFEWLIYCSIFFDAMTLPFSKTPWTDTAFSVPVYAILGVLAWAAARHGTRWAAWILVVLIAVFNLLFVAFWSDPEMFSTVDRVSGVITGILDVVALAFYFFGAPRAAPTQAVS